MSPESSSPAGLMWLSLSLLATLAAAGLMFHGVRLALAQWRSSLQSRLGHGLSDAFIWLSPEQLTNLAIYLLVIPGCLLLVSGYVPWLGFSALVGGLVGPKFVLRWVRARRRQRIRAQLPDAIQLFAGSLRAGMSVSSALGLLASQCAAPIADEFAMVVRQLRLGHAIDGAMSFFEARLGLEEAVMFSAALKTASSVGGNLADTLDRVAITLRERLVVEGKIDALTAQGRMQGWVVGLLPFFLIPILEWIEPDAMQPLWHTWAGWATLVGVSTLVGIGLYWITKIVDIDV